MQGQTLTDTELWKLVQNNHRDAYGILYRRYMELIFVEIHKRVESRADAEDLTQELFQHIWEKRSSIDIHSKFFSYLWRSAQNRILNYYRDKKIPASMLETWIALPDTVSCLAEVPDYFEQSYADTMQSVLDQERLLLPDKMKQVYILRYEQELPVEEIAKQLYISSNTVHNHLKAMRKRFAEALRKASFLFSLLC